MERVYREIRIRSETKITRVIRHPYSKMTTHVDIKQMLIRLDAMEIQFKKPSMKYKAGQWLFLNAPSVSSQQWHPFTITSCPFDDYISVHVRQVGDFTRALADTLGAGQAQSKLYDEVDQNGIYEVAL